MTKIPLMNGRLLKGSTGSKSIKGVRSEKDSVLGRTEALERRMLIRGKGTLRRITHKEDYPKREEYMGN